MIDSHCHLDHEPLLSDLQNVLQRSKDVGIEKLLTISTSLESFSRIKELVNRDEMIYGTIGIHPHESSTNIITANEIIDNLKNNKKIIGIGETGLDFYYNNSEKDKQIASFIEHIKASIKTNIPLIVHSRNAENETLEILNEYKDENIKILMHCFTGSYEFAKKMMDLDAYFSASGIITFKKSNELNETFKKIPNNRLLIETDSPFLAPVPMRGKQNEPSFLKYTLLHLSKIKNLNSSDIEKLTSENFENLFDISR